MSRNAAHPHGASAKASSGPMRPGAYLAQLIVQNDGGLRGVIGRSDVAKARDRAYASALSKRPSVAALALKGQRGMA